jgi:hypothetical protein
MTQAAAIKVGWEFEKSQSIRSGEFVAAIESARDATTIIAWDDRIGAGGFGDAPTPTTG